jgi:hypothetical protein
MGWLKKLCPEPKFILSLVLDRVFHIQAQYPKTAKWWSLKRVLVEHEVTENPWVPESYGITVFSKMLSRIKVKNQQSQDARNVKHRKGRLSDEIPVCGQREHRGD